MTVALSPNASQPVKLRPLTRQPQVRQWQDELNYLEMEVTFYQKLLRMSIGNGQPESKPSMYKLLNEFSGYLDTTVPDLKKALDALHLPADTGTEAASAFQRQLEHHRLALRILKTGVFPHISDMQKFTIW
jgi:hypothetical protein